MSPDEVSDFFDGYYLHIGDGTSNCSGEDHRRRESACAEMAQWVNQLIAEEREACAKGAEGLYGPWRTPHDNPAFEAGYTAAIEDAAANIRRRSQS